jgi:hypothetical protein
MFPQLTVKFKSQNGDARATDPVRVSVTQKDSNADPVHIKIKSTPS